MNQSSVYFSILFGVNVVLSFSLPAIEWIVFLFDAAFLSKVGYRKMLVMHIFVWFLFFIKNFSLANVFVSWHFSFVVVLLVVMVLCSIISLLITVAVEKILKTFFKRFYARLTQTSSRT